MRRREKKRRGEKAGKKTEERIMRRKVNVSVGFAINAF